MIKATHISLGLAALLVFPAIAPAQDSAINMAAQQSVINQANSIVLRQKLVDAQAAAQVGDVAGAAKLYQECVTLAQKIGPGIKTETAQAIAGLSASSMALAREAQSNGDLFEADIRVRQVLQADPKNPQAVAFKKQNDELLAANKGKIPSQAVMQQVPAILNEKADAGTLVQDGRIFYEMGKFDEAEAKMNEALKIDPGNTAAVYYLKLTKQAKYISANNQHNVDTQQRMTQIEKRWVLPTASAQLPSPNPYATNTLTYTGPGRQSIIDKLDRIRLDNVSYDGLPLSEVVKDLIEKSKLRDPQRKGINFMINPNPDQSGSPIAATGQGGNTFFGAATPVPTTGAIDPATGLPVAGPTGGGSTEAVDIGSAVTVKLSLSDVRMADVLNAIVRIAEHPPGHQIKYDIEDFGVIFTDKGAETPQLFMRAFKVDPNTFYSGLESVGATSFGSSSSQSGSGGSGGGSSGGSGGQNTGGGVVGVVNAFAGSGQIRSQATQGQGGGGGGGGGGGNGQGASNPLNAGQPGQAGGGGGNNQNDGGLNYITQITLASQVSAAARNFFTTLGVNLNAPVGKAVFFNDRLGVLFVKATEDDLDTIDRAIQTLNQVAPQVHIKSRFIEVSQQDDKAIGFDWYLGQFNMGGGVVGQGGSSGSLYSPNSPSGAFPGSTTATEIPASATDQNITSGLRNQLGAPAVGTITGILTNPNFQVALRMLQQRSGVETLAEPEVVTTSGRQTQMRATTLLTVISSFNFQQGASGISQTGTTQ